MDAAWFDSLYGHYQAAIASGVFLRNLRKRRVVRVTLGNTSYIVKAYHLTWLHRLSGIRPHSLTGSRLLARWTPPVLANVVRDGWQVTVYNDLNGPDLYEIPALLASGTDVTAAFAAAGRLLAEIHNNGCFHGDCKAPNFVVNRSLPELPPVAIIDCDHVKPYRHLPDARRSFNLAQFISCYTGYEKSPLPDWLKTALLSYRETAALDDAAWSICLKAASRTVEENRHIENRVGVPFVKQLVSDLLRQ